MTLDLNSMSRKELQKLAKDVEKAIATLADRERQTALAAAEKAAQEHGFSLADLGAVSGSKGKKSKTVGIPKYRNPANPSQTWTGKGRRPQWIIDGEAAGRPMKDFEI
jgi:DNA-binding protein H-NS